MSAGHSGEGAAPREVAAFPELFDGLEAFIEQHVAGARRLCIRLTMAAIPGGALLVFALDKIA